MIPMKASAATASRWILYHGTSSYRLTQILNDNRLNLAQSGAPKLSLTPERSVAEYFACNAVSGDRRDHPREESEPVLLALDGEGLMALMYALEDDTDEGEEYEWENEIACWDPIDPLDEVLIDVEAVPLKRAQPYFELELLEQRRDAYRPVGPRLSDHELRKITEMMEQLEEGRISEHEADQIAAAMSRRRAWIRFNDGAAQSTA